MERAAKRLVDEVKVSGLAFCLKCICTVACFNICNSCVGRNENGEVQEKVLRPD